MTSPLTFKIVAHNSPEYDQTVELRDAILRKPLGMVFTAEQLAAENEQIHLATYNDTGKLVACLVLMKKENGRLKMRQVAVAEKHQLKGIGQAMILHSEQWGQDNGFHTMFCHARDTAVPFYQKMNYDIIGDEFEEVGIKHWLMEKKL